MLTAIHNRFTKLATWPGVALLVVGFVASDIGFNVRHKALGHTETPDGRGWYTPSEVRELFELWGADGRALYAWTEVTLDLAFPLVYGTLLAALLARLFPEGRGRWTVLVPLAGAAADLVENVTMATLAWTYDGREAGAARVAAYFTAAKTACFLGSMFMLVVGAGAVWGRGPKATAGPG